MKTALFFLSNLVFLISCVKTNQDFDQAYKSINSNEIREFTKKIGSDEFLGRMPGTKGEEITINYLKGEFEKMGLKPAFNGSYFQRVPLVEITNTAQKIIEITTEKGNIQLRRDSDFVAFSMRISPKIEIKNSNLVFVGFGVKAPEFDWDDFKGTNLKGKTILMLVNDPGFYTGDTTLFKGKTMTYYGRWTYKFDEAARQGAEAVLIIHNTEGAGYSFAVPQNRASSPNFYLRPEDGYQSRCAAEGWITSAAAQKIFAASGLDLQTLIKQASNKNFKPIELKSKFNLIIESKQRNVETQNVAAYVEGTDLKSECIVFTAHWDHFGIGVPVNGDSIYNGAVDNGTSLAWMLEIAHAFTNLKEKPRRSVLFLAPTCEEQGLLGSAFYVKYPAFEMAKTVANFNNDMMLPNGKNKDVMVTGWGQSELEDLLLKAAQKQDRYLFPDPNSQTGMYFRSDHFSFAKMGVPSLFARGNCDNREFGKQYAAEKEKEYLKNCYHRPQDQYDEKTWNFDGITEDAQLAFEVGYQLVNSAEFPKWKTGSEFKAIREKDLKTNK